MIVEEEIEEILVPRLKKTEEVLNPEIEEIETVVVSEIETIDKTSTESSAASLWTYFASVVLTYIFILIIF